MRPASLCLISALSWALSYGQTTVIRPKEIHDVLVNPGMGIETFQRFNGQELNPGLKWSEVGPEKPMPDASGKVNFPPSSVAYLRWFWSQLEPRQGEYQWSIIDNALSEARRHGQKLAMRLMPYDQSNPLPEWYLHSGAKRANKPEDRDGKVWSPDADDPFYSKRWSALIREAGKRYDGHPDLNHVDISTVGYWGEGWGPYLPAWTVQQQLVDLYFEAFPHTPLLMNFDEPKALSYGVKLGAGWRLDCWGDMGRPGRNFAHMLDLYPQQVVRAGIQDAWRSKPVALETCGTAGHWKEWKFDLRPILDQALRWHASTINLKSSAIPAEWQSEFDAFQKQIGYRFVLKRLEYRRKSARGSMMPLSMWWFNAGVAPVYREYTLALAVDDTVIPLQADIRQWLPGDSVYEGAVYLDPSLAPGTHRVKVAILDPRTRQPAIQLSIEGRQSNGWYDLGEITIE